MSNIDELTRDVLSKIDEVGFKEEGAYNLRYNGTALCHGDTENIKIVKKTDKQGIDIYISKNAQGEYVHIPVVVTNSGMTDEVYNDFHVEAGANVNIIAGCGIHNSGCDDSRHNGVHAFYVGKGATVRYEEKHYGEGEGTGARILNPVTKIYLEEDSVFVLDTAQIKGVDSTTRITEVEIGPNARLNVEERLLTHGNQSAESNMDVVLSGEGSVAQIVSRSVAKENSKQVFHPRAIGKNSCHAHIQCDSIIMDKAQVRSIPEIDAQHVDAAIIHEAAIGRINNEQMIKLNTFGLSDEEAENVIIDNFLN